MRVEYSDIKGGRISHTSERDSFSEFASIYNNENEHVGGLQILYFTNGLKNMAYIERVFIKPQFQKNGYATHLLNDVISHIIETDIQICNKNYENIVATNNEDEAFDKTYSRGLDEIFLIAENRLSKLYENVGFVNKSNYENPTDESVFKINLADIRDDSLEKRLSSLS